MTATECAKQAGYSDKSAISQASVMRNPKYFPHVVKAIEDLQREYAEASKIDFVKHSRELDRLRDQAVINGESIGVEVIEVTEDNNVEISPPEKHTKK